MNQSNQRPYRPATPGGSARPAASGKRVRFNLPPDLWKILAGGLVVVVLAYFLQVICPNGFPLKVKKIGNGSIVQAISEIYSSGPIRLNEVMSGNRSALNSEDGSFEDWVEVMNIGESAVDISGYSLAKAAKASHAFRFPEGTVLGAGESVIVFADSKLRSETGSELHAPFRVSSTGDTMMLFNAGGTAIDTINIPPLTKDTSYVRVSTSEWTATDHPTPGMSNTEESYKALHECAEDSPVIVTELMASNESAVTDENGQYCDYIELYNRSSETVDLSGWYLSDDWSQPRKWRFPQAQIAPGAYLVVFASGMDKTDDPAHLHTSFKLSSEGEQVVLSGSNGRLMDVVDYDLLRKDQAWALQGDGTWAVPAAPTPGSAN